MVQGRAIMNGENGPQGAPQTNQLEKLASVAGTFVLSFQLESHLYSANFFAPEKLYFQTHIYYGFHHHGVVSLQWTSNCMTFA